MTRATAWSACSRNSGRAAPPRAVGEKMQAALSKPPKLSRTTLARAVEQVAGNPETGDGGGGVPSYPSSPS